MNAPIHKPSGWKGLKTDAYWTKDSKYGVRYMCSTCGRQSSAWIRKSRADALEHLPPLSRTC